MEKQEQKQMEKQEQKQEKQRRAYDGLGTVQPIVFGYLAEASAGACDLIKSVADELAPRYADLYLLESVEAAVGIATDRLREEIGAAVGLQGAGAGDPRPHPLLLPWQPSCRRQEAPTAGKVAQPRSARALPRPPTGPLLPPPQAPVAAQGSPGGQSWWLGCGRPHLGRTGAAAQRAP